MYLTIYKWIFVTDLLLVERKETEGFALFDQDTPPL